MDIINDFQNGLTISQISATFHNTLIAGFSQIMQVDGEWVDCASQLSGKYLDQNRAN
ncbi:MAG: hypothetical protein F6K30_14835 [Cyanothece sp. SIO2G6]|nr:hypothetical protein [Cyanothece sp. SIO2G6]